MTEGCIARVEDWRAWGLLGFRLQRPRFGIAGASIRFLQSGFLKGLWGHVSGFNAWGHCDS